MYYVLLSSRRNCFIFRTKCNGNNILWGDDEMTTLANDTDKWDQPSADSTKIQLSQRTGPSVFVLYAIPRLTFYRRAA